MTPAQLIACGATSSSTPAKFREDGGAETLSGAAIANQDEYRESHVTCAIDGSVARGLNSGR